MEITGLGNDLHLPASDCRRVSVEPAMTMVIVTSSTSLPVPASNLSGLSVPSVSVSCC